MNIIKCLHYRQHDKHGNKWKDTGTSIAQCIYLCLFSTSKWNTNSHSYNTGEKFFKKKTHKYIIA